MKNLGNKIAESLTEQEAGELLTAVWNAITEEQEDEVLDNVPSSIATAVKNILESKPSAEPIRSTSKLEEQWKKFDSAVSQTVSELGKEEGRLIDHDRHWEPPEFLYEEFEDELESSFATVLPQIKQYAKAGVVDEGFVFSFADDVSDGFDEFPEWMGIQECGEDITLHESVTKVLLSILLEASTSTEEFINWTFELDRELDCCALDSDPFLNFFFEELSDTQLTEAHTFLTCKDCPKQLKKELNNSNTDWHQLLKELNEECGK